MLLKIKWVCDEVKRESFLSSFLVMFRLGLWLKVRFIAISIFLKWNHGDIINRSNNSVSTLENLLKSASLWSQLHLENWNETRNTSSPGFFLKILILIFQSINMDVGHKLLLQLFLIGSCLFCSKIGKKICIEILCNLRLLLRLSAKFS